MQLYRVTLRIYLRPFVMKCCQIAVLLPLYCYLYIRYIGNARGCIYALYTRAIYKQ